MKDHLILEPNMSVLEALQWTLADHGFSADASVLTSRGWINAQSVAPGDQVVTTDGPVTVVGTHRLHAAAAIRIATGQDSLHVAPGQLVQCRHWVCKPLIGCSTALVPAAALERGVRLVLPSRGVDLVSLSVARACVIVVDGWQLGIPKQGFAAGHDWHALREPVPISPGIDLADPESCRQLDQAGVVLRARSAGPADTGQDRRQ